MNRQLAYTMEGAAESFNPMARKIAIAGHQLVNADCRRLSPTKPVSHSQLGETQWANAREANTITPANNLTARSTVIAYLLWFQY